MFDHLSYIGYTLLFCVPPLLLIWLRREFFEILVGNLRIIILSTIILTIYGSLIWPIALKYGAWAYSSEKISNVKLMGLVFIDDVIWWIFIGLIFSSFISLSTYYEDRGVDIVWREIRGLLASFRNALRGLKIVTLERNSTIHVAIAVFVLLEGVLFRISKMEWLFVMVAIGAVLGFEILNSAVERLAAKYSAQQDAEIGLIKDAAAAGVLVASAAAAVIGFVIFMSRILRFLL